MRELVYLDLAVAKCRPELFSLGPCTALSQHVRHAKNFRTRLKLLSKKTGFNANSQMLLWRNLDRVDDRNYLIMAADSPYVRVGQIFIRGRRTVHATQTRKQKIVFK
jgi:hypothetical protein